MQKIHVGVILDRLSKRAPFHSQRDAQGPVIRREAAKHKRGRGSSRATGVSRHRGSLPTDLLETGERVIHSQHRQNQVNKMCKL